MKTLPLNMAYTWLRSMAGHPRYRWWVIGGALVYLLNPLDIAPDFLPIVGQIDDTVVVTIVAAEVSQVLLNRAKANKQAKSTPVNSVGN